MDKKTSATSIKREGNGWWSLRHSQHKLVWKSIQGNHQQEKCQFLRRLNLSTLAGKWQPTPVFLPGKPYGQRGLVGYSPWGHKESDTTEWLSTPWGQNLYHIFCCWNHIKYTFLFFSNSTALLAQWMIKNNFQVEKCHFQAMIYVQPIKYYPV